VEVNFHSGTIATLSENGELLLTPDAASHHALRLNKGVVAVRHTCAQPARVNVQNATILVQGEAGFPAICRIAHSGRITRVFADRGRVQVRGRGKPQLLLPGKSLRLEAGMPQVAGQPAGKVTNAIPQETIQRAGQTAQLPLKVNDGVNWEDTVRTLGTGRVRIGLLDGSVLNVGARAVMRITKHNPQSQQTELELQLGKLRGQVVKLSQPGASFQVKTNTAVIGVVGTIVLIDALLNLTQVQCLDGLVSVRNIDPAVPGERVLRPGEQTSVGAGQPPGAVTPVGAAEVAQGLNLTNAGEAPLPELAKFGEVAQPGGVAAPPRAPVRPALNTASLVAGGASAGLGGAAAAKASGARDDALLASGAADRALAAGESASEAAADAANTATAFGTGLEDYIEGIYGGGECGCQTLRRAASAADQALAAGESASGVAPRTADNATVFGTGVEESIPSLSPGAGRRGRLP
jgi:ferric-dicitrate binding protein FerR (iron transport regulator)